MTRSITAEWASCCLLWVLQFYQEVNEMNQQRKRPETETEEAEIQLGHARSVRKDEQIKRVIRKQPKRDEPKVDSVESDDIPPR